MAASPKVDGWQYDVNEECCMSEDKKPLKQLHDEHRAENWPMQNWRAWGSWFSWGSPVGLGLFLLALAGTVWILANL